MQNNQNTFIRIRAPKLKNDWMTIILKVLLIGGIFFSTLYMGKRNFNSLFMAVVDSSYANFMGISLFSYVTSMSKSMNMFMKIIYPVAASALFFLLYILYAKLFAKIVFRQYCAIGLKFDIRNFRVCLDTSFIVMTILLGAQEIIFGYFPLTYNLTDIFISPLIAVGAMAIFFASFSRGLDKKYYVILLHTMVIPAIVLILFA